MKSWPGGYWLFQSSASLQHYSLCHFFWLIFRAIISSQIKRQGIYRQGPKLIWHMILILAKNLLGVVFILLGIALLVLPGQGLLTILIGLILLDFPGKYAAERWIIQQPAMFNAINWIRKKAGSDELKLPPREKI